MSLLAMEWGFRAHEKGMNLEMARAEFATFFPEQPKYWPNLFTEEEQNTMVEMVMDEIRDCVKNLAHEQLENEPLIELLGYVDNDPEVTVGCLKALEQGNASMEDYESGEHPEHELAARHMKRFDLVVQAPEECWNLTPLGWEYIERYS